MRAQLGWLAALTIVVTGCGGGGALPTAPKDNTPAVAVEAPKGSSPGSTKAEGAKPSSDTEWGK